MATFDGGFSSRPVVLRLVVTPRPGNIVTNSTIVDWALYAIRNGNTTAFSNWDNTWGVVINGNGYSGVWVYNFGTEPTKLIATGATTVPHNANGTKTLSVSASANGSINGGLIGSASCGGSFALATIPRASNPTFSVNPVDAGDPVTITTNRADSSFTHTIEYAIGSASGTIGTGIGASTVWTPPLSLLNQLPNATTAPITITTRTFSGSTLVGTSTATLTLRAPAEIVPTFGTVTHSENETPIASAIGAYVQGFSRLVVGITSPAGVYGSTITAQKVEVVGQADNFVTRTGATPLNATTPQKLTGSGTITLRGTVTDSRGRTAVETVTITVLAYAPPVVSGFSLQRSLVDGTPDDDGIYIRVDLDVAASSLLVSAVQKNELRYRISTSPRGAGTFTEQADVATGGLTFADHHEVGTYPVEQAFDVLVEVYDALTVVPLGGTVAVAAVFVHFGLAGQGVGFGKYWERGTIDASGRIYQRDGKQVVDQDDIATELEAGAVLLATEEEAEAGTEPAHVLTPATARSQIAAQIVEAAQAVPMCRVVRGSGALTINSGGYTRLSGTNVWSLTNTGAIAERGGMVFEPATGSIVVPVDGLYEVELCASFASNTSGVLLIVKKNNTTADGNGRVAQNGTPANIGSVAWGSLSALIPLVGGNRLTPAVFTAGGTTTIAGTSEPTYFAVRLVEAF